MKLVGMLDSPYVRRVAIGYQFLGLHFEHQSLSVFRTFDEFARINPVVKAPTLVCDDGTVLMDSNLMIQYGEALARPRSLLPNEPAALRRELRLTGLALAACEKSVQIVYEHGQRPADKRHDPWLERVKGQTRAAYRELEHELARAPIAPERNSITHAGIAIAVGWYFSRQMITEIVPAEEYPNLAALSSAAERLPEFVAAPYGGATFRYSTTNG